MPIIELKQTTEFEAAYTLVQQLNPGLTQAEFRTRLEKMLRQGYRCIAYVEQGEYIGLCGFWEGTRFWCGDFIDLDNVVVDDKARRQGIGKKLVDWVEQEARRQNRNQIGLDCYVTHHGAHNFYLRERFIIKGYHLIKPL